MPSSSNATNVGLVAKREYIERVRSRAFVFSTLLLVGLAVIVALIPLGVRLLDKATVTRVGVAADDPALAARAVAVMDGALNAELPGDSRRPPVRLRGPDERRWRPRTTSATACWPGQSSSCASPTTASPSRCSRRARSARTARSCSRSARSASGSSTGPRPSPPRPSRSSCPRSGSSMPWPRDGGTGLAVDTAEYASRRIVGIVFVVLSFLTLVFYGLWVASGVVAEKASRVMELLISRRDRAAARRGQDRRHRAGGPDPGQPRPAAGRARAAALGTARPGDVRDRRCGAVAGRPVAGPAGGVPRLLHAGIRALRGAVRRRGLAAQPARGPPDRGAAAVDPRDHGLLPGGAGAVRRRGSAHPVRLVRAALEPVRDDGAAVGGVGRAVGDRPLDRAAGRDRADRDAGSRSGSTGPACSCTGSPRRCGPSCARLRG